MRHVEQVIRSLLDLLLLIKRHQRLYDLLVLQKLKHSIRRDYDDLVVLGQGELYHYRHNYILFMAGDSLLPRLPPSPRNFGSLPGLAHCRVSAKLAKDRFTHRIHLCMPPLALWTFGCAKLTKGDRVCGRLKEGLLSTCCLCVCP